MNYRYNINTINNNITVVDYNTVHTTFYKLTHTVIEQDVISFNITNKTTTSFKS